MYIFVCFIQNVSNIQHGVNKENLQIESSSLLHISKHPEYSYSRITILLKTLKEGGRQGNGAKCHWIEGLQGNSTQQYLHSKQQQGSPGFLCAVPHASKHSTWQKLHSMVQRCPAGPCGAPHVAENYIEFGIEQDKYL